MQCHTLQGEFASARPNLQPSMDVGLLPMPGAAGPGAAAADPAAAGEADVPVNGFGEAVSEDQPKA